MKPSLALEANRGAIRSMVERYCANNVCVLDSVPHSDDHESSDLDILIDLTSETALCDISAICHELFQPLGVPVDVLTSNALSDKCRAKMIAKSRPV